MSNIWYVPHPTSQWVEDVAEIARREGLQIIDPAVVAERVGETENPPKLTPRTAKPKPRGRAKKDDA